MIVTPGSGPAALQLPRLATTTIPDRFRCQPVRPVQPWSGRQPRPSQAATRPASTFSMSELMGEAVAPAAGAVCRGAASCRGVLSQSEAILQAHRDHLAGRAESAASRNRAASPDPQRQPRVVTIIDAVHHERERPPRSPPSSLPRSRFCPTVADVQLVTLVRQRHDGLPRRYTVTRTYVEAGGLMSYGTNARGRLPSSRRLRWPRPQWHEARRPPGHRIYQIRIRHQRSNRASAPHRGVARAVLAIADEVVR